MPDLRLIRAEILKLRRRTGMVVVCTVLTVIAVALFYAVLAGLHLADAGRSPAGGVEHFKDVVAILAMAGSVAGVIVGATAGAADIEAGVFRDLVATGRSRFALFFARVPGAWAIVLPVLALAVALAAGLATILDGTSPAPTGGEITSAAIEVLTAGALTAAVCVGLAALTGSRGTVIGVALAFQLGVSPLLAQVGPLGDARFGIPQVAIARLGGADDLELAVATAIAILLAWATVALAAGAWRSATQEI
jgi:hypothetical protein